MGQISLSRICGACNGAGIRTYNISPGGPLVTEDPCSICGGDGRVIAFNGIDDTLIQQIITTQADHTDKITYIYNKTDNIINKLNDIKDKCNQIWDKVK